MRRSTALTIFALAVSLFLSAAGMAKSPGVATIAGPVAQAGPGQMPAVPGTTTDWMAAGGAIGALVAGTSLGLKTAHAAWVAILKQHRQRTIDARKDYLAIELEEQQSRDKANERSLSAKVKMLEAALVDAERAVNDSMAEFKRIRESHHEQLREANRANLRTQEQLTEALNRLRKLDGDRREQATAINQNAKILETISGQMPTVPTETPLTVDAGTQDRPAMKG